MQVAAEGTRGHRPPAATWRPRAARGDAGMQFGTAGPLEPNPQPPPPHPLPMASCQPRAGGGGGGGPVGATAAKKAFCGTSIIQGFPTPPSPAEGSSIIDALQLWGGGHTTQLGTRLATHTAPPALCPRVLPPPPPHPGHLKGGGGPFLMPSQQRLHQPWARVGFAHACGRASGTHVGTWGGGGVPEGHHTWRAHASGHAEHAAATCARCSVTYVCARLRYIRVRTAPLHTCACLCICECCHGRRAAEGFGGGGGAELGGLGVR